MENIRQKIAEIITHTHRTPLEQADEILLLFSVSGRSEQLPDFLYESDGEIKIGYHGDTVVTDEWNKWKKGNCH